MKKLLFVLAATLAFVGCTGDIEDRLTNLEERVDKLEEKLNDEVADLAELIDALNDNVYVTGVTEITEGGEVVGYTIALSKGQAITIYHGEDGKDGASGSDGKDGKDGEDGKDGKDGSDGSDGNDGATPKVGVVLEDGVYYWTVNGEKLTDADGNYIVASDLTCPKFKKEGDTWFISLDGVTWNALTSSNQGGGIFTDFTYTDSTVTFHIGDTTITLPRESQFALLVEQTKDIVVLPYSEVTVKYTIKGATENTAVYTVADAGWGVTVEPESNSAGKLIISSPATISGKVIVFAGDESHAGMVALSFEEGAITVENNSLTIGKEGGELLLPVSTNLNYEVVVPDNVDWIKHTATRAMRDETVVLTVDANDGMPREASVSLVSAGKTLQTITIAQEAGIEPTYSLEDITGTWENASGNWEIEAYEGNGTNVKISTMYGYASCSIYADFDLFYGTLTIATPQSGFSYDGNNYYLAVRQGYYNVYTNGFDAVFTLSEDKNGLAWNTTDYTLCVFYDITYTYYPTVMYSGEQLKLTRPTTGEGGEEGGEGSGDVALVGTWTVSYTNNADSALSFDMPIVASDNAEKGNVILKRWMDYSARETATTVYATYDAEAKTLSIPNQALTSSAPYYGDTLSAKDVNNTTLDPIVLTVSDDATVMTIDKDVKFGTVYYGSFTSYGTNYTFTKQ